MMHSESFAHFYRDFSLQFVIPDIKTIIEAMALNDASLRLTPIEGLSRLGAVVHSLFLIHSLLLQSRLRFDGYFALMYEGMLVGNKIHLYVVSTLQRTTTDGVSSSSDIAYDECRHITILPVSSHLPIPDTKLLFLTANRVVRSALEYYVGCSLNDKSNINLHCRFFWSLRIHSLDIFRRNPTQVQMCFFSMNTYSQSSWKRSFVTLHNFFGWEVER